MRTLFLFAFLWPGVTLAHDALPLIRGHFVPAGIGCNDPENKDYIDYEGHGYGAYEAGCEIRSAVKHGATYRVKQHCSFAGDDYGEEAKEWKIINRKAFKINGVTYRYCRS